MPTVGHQFKRATRIFRLGPAAVSMVGFAGVLVALYHLEGPVGNFFRIHDAATATLLANTLSRASVAIISAVFASLFLAIPVTATMYTPQLIELFVGAWVNRIMLTGFVFSACLALWLGRMTDQGNIPNFSIFLSLFLFLTLMALLPPYLFYVFRFLDPETIIDRVAGTVIRAMQPNRRGPIAVRQRELSSRIHQLGNISLRALDRADREVALASVAALERCAGAYFDVEDRHPEAWFTVDTSQFPGLSREAVALLNRQHIWVEMELLRQLARAYEAALAKVPDVLSAISRIERHFALVASARDDGAGLNLAIRFFNNFLREAIKRRDLRAVFDVLYQYRLLAIALWDSRPALVVRMAKHLEYYGRMAASAGLGFAQDLVAYDLGAVLAHAATRERPWIELLVKVFLSVRKPGAPPGPGALTPGLFKARLILSAVLLECGKADLAARVEKSLIGVSRDLLQHAREDLLGDVEECFWEVTDRQLNLDYLTPTRKAHVADILQWVEKNAS